MIAVNFAITSAGQDYSVFLNFLSEYCFLTIIKIEVIIAREEYSKGSLILDFVAINC